MTKLIDNETGEVVGQSKENALILANEQFKLEPTGLKVVGDPTFEALIEF